MGHLLGKRAFPMAGTPIQGFPVMRTVILRPMRGSCVRWWAAFRNLLLLRRLQSAIELVPSRVRRGMQQACTVSPDIGGRGIVVSTAAGLATQWECQPYLSEE